MPLKGIKITTIPVAGVIFICGFLLGYGKIIPSQTLQSAKNIVLELLLQNEQTFNTQYCESIDRLATDQPPGDTQTGKALIEKYTFFVAGHVYGDPKNPRQGIYLPFKQQFASLNSTSGLAFGVLTGDLVWESSRVAWERVVDDLKTLSVKTYIAPGNHDVGTGHHTAKRDIFVERFGATYRAFVHMNDLFIILDPNLDGWNIKGKQLIFLREQIQKTHNHVRNIFIFTHQLIWWEPAREEFSALKPNSQTGRAEQVNFWSDLFPILEESEANVYLFAGDVGASPNGHELFYSRIGNVVLVASGMGGGERDNYLLVTVDQGEVGILAVNFGTCITCC